MPFFFIILKMAAPLLDRSFYRAKEKCSAFITQQTMAQLAFGMVELEDGGP